MWTKERGINAGIVFTAATIHRLNTKRWKSFLLTAEISGTPARDFIIHPCFLSGTAAQLHSRSKTVGKMSKKRIRFWALKKTFTPAIFYNASIRRIRDIYCHRATQIFTREVAGRWCLRRLRILNLHHIWNDNMYRDKPHHGLVFCQLSFLLPMPPHNCFPRKRGRCC